MLVDLELLVDDVEIELEVLEVLRLVLWEVLEMDVETLVD